ncbi:MAG TPA: tRNA pseudouridine(13) synthase TruD [bacterium]
MKLKVCPEDFIVEEVIDLPLSQQGPYTIIKLRKQYWNTLDVIDYAARRLSVARNRFERAGLKDRYSLSTQYLSFKGKFPGIIADNNFSLTPVGYAMEPVSPAKLVANKFTIVLRDLNDHESVKAADNCALVKTWGIPNYFDEQRFGSARHHQGFFAKKLVQEHYKGALKLLLCYPYKEDGAAIKRFKKCCLDSWGVWERCAEQAPREYRGIMNFLLSHPKDYREAIKCIDRELLKLYLLAYQSYIFNQALYLLIRDGSSGTREVAYSVGTFLFYGELKDIGSLREVELPMVNEKTKLAGSPGDKVKEVLAEEGIELKKFALRKMRFRGVRFKPFMRKVLVFPGDLNIEPEQPDDRYPGKKKIKLEFSLPSGSYATMVVKRLMI